MSNPDDFFGGGNPSASFKELNVPVGGTVLSVGPERQQSDPKGELQWWDKAETQPKMQLPIDVQTDLRNPEDPSDDGVRTIYVKGDMKRAVGQAVRVAGQRGAPKVGGTLHVAWTASEAATVRGHNDKKIYSAKYTAPAPADSFFGEQAAPAAQPAMSGATAASSAGRPPWVTAGETPF